MFAKIENWLSLGGQYTAAAVIYLGMSLMLAGSALLDYPLALATDAKECSYTARTQQEGEWVDVTYDGCPEGKKCCEGECIADTEICCEDGTHGDAETCICCDTCGEFEFGFWTTIECDDE